ncbi:MAG: nucleotidyltransferase domain-containing protein [Planctomycetota bacterium]
MSDVSSFEKLKSEICQEWHAITRANTSAAQHSATLRNMIHVERPPANTSIVAFGSLARGEWTSASDVDWTLLIDGPSDMRHFEVTQCVERILKDNGYVEPGPTGTFGSMSSSHELVHHIGGIEDSNQNLTRRMLLLLESMALSDAITRDRVVRSILERYVIGDPPATTPGRYHVPLFLFNDVVRFWRTMAVDYATKKWQRNDTGWAIRNIKLRMSRKLLYVKGMLMCFLCDEAFAGKRAASETDLVELELLEMCKSFADTSALDMLCEALLRFAKRDTITKTVDAYDAFLATLDDEAQRNELKNLPFEQYDEGLFGAMRRNSRDFRDGIQELFFDCNNDLAKLTKRYGVF